MVLTTKDTQTEQEFEFSVKPVEKSYFSASPVSVADEDPLFEVEKEYDNITLPTAKSKSSILPEFEILPEKKPVAVAKEEIAENKQISLSNRGKVLAICCSIIMALLFTMVIYNAVVLGAKSREVSRLASQIELKQSEIDSLKNMLAEAESEGSVQSFLTQNGSSLRKATSLDKVRLVLNAKELEQISAPTNWFDKLCNFLSNLF